MYRSNNQRLRSKLIKVYIYWGVLPIIIIIALGILMYSSNMKRVINQFISEDISKYNNCFNQTLLNYEYLGYSLATDIELINEAYSMLKENETRKIKEEILLKFQSLVYNELYLDSITFINKDDKYVNCEKGLVTQSDSKVVDYEFRRKLYSYCVQKESITYLPFYNIKNNKLIFYLGVKVEDKITKKLLGVLVLGLDEKLIRNIYNPTINNKTKYLIYDKFNTVISADDNMLIGSNIEKYYENNINSKLYKSFEVIIPKVNWNVIGITDQTQMLNNIRNIFVITSVGGIIIIIICICGIVYITAYYERDIKDIADKINKFGCGDIDVKIDRNHHDELKAVVYQFNNMGQKMKKLISDLELKNREIQIETELKRKAEINALEAQINPHFLYNTLDSINWIAIENEQFEISEMISCLANLLRYSISNIDGKVKIKDEVIWLNQYLLLQQKRFYNVFNYEIDVDEGVLDRKIHKLLIQPIVENSILHAFEKIKYQGYIIVRFFNDSNGDINIEINDNGVGMNKKEVERIERLISGEKFTNNLGIGISNMINRLYMYYGRECEILINSEIGIGTCIKVKISEKE